MFTIANKVIARRIFVVALAGLLAAVLFLLILSPAFTTALSVPVVEDQTFSVLENSATGTFVGNIVATDTTTYTIIAGNSSGAFALNAASGALTVADGTQLDFESSPVFTLTVEVEDSIGQKDSAVMTINVININDAPVVDDQTFNVAENSPNGTPVATVAASDADNDLLKYTILFGNTGGTFNLNLNSGELTVADNTLLDFETMPVFTLIVKVSDGGLMDIAIITINLADANDLPVAVDDDGYITSENNSLVGATPSVLANDSDQDVGDTLTAVLDSQPANGTVSLNSNGIFTYTPNLNFDGIDTFTYFAYDGLANSALAATVTITVTGVNDPPTANDDPGYTTLEDTPLTVSAPGILGNDIDPENDPLTAVLEGAPAAGTLQLLSDGSFVYTPTLGYVGVVTFTYHAEDDAPLPSNTATVTITVISSNDPPTANDDTFSVAENSPNTTFVGTVTASDPDVGDSLAYSIIGGNTGTTFAIDGGNGDISVNDNTLLDFETNPQFVLTVIVTDTGDLTDTAQITINVDNVNEFPPDINAQTFSVAEDSANNSLVGTVVVTDSDGIDTTAFAITAGDPGGTFAIDNGGDITVADTSILDFETTPVYNLTVVVTDSGGLMDTAPVTINVQDANDAPVIDNGDLSVTPSVLQETGVITLTGVFADQDSADAHTITINWDDGSPDTILNLAAGVDTFSATHTYTDDPAGLPDDYLIGVTVADATLSDTANATVTVNNVAPVLGNLAAAPLTLTEGQTISLTGSISEVNPLDSFSVMVDWGDGVGTISNYPAGSTAFLETHTYLDNFQPATILVTLSDDDGGSDVKATAVTVTNVAPTVDAGPPQAVFVGDPAIFQGSVSDPGAWDTHTYDWDFGDGSGISGTLTPFHFYVGGVGVYTATLTVTDDDGAVASDMTTITVVSPSDLVGLKRVSGDFDEGGTVVYTINLSNTGATTQLNNPGPEFEDILPPELSLVAARVISGGGTATATTATNTVTWSGQILAGQQVVIEIEAIILPGTLGQTVSNQGQINYDADGNGTNEAITFTDDPAQPGNLDPTRFTVQEFFLVYLPLITSNLVSAPDLIVTNISANSDLIEITIKNQGNRATVDGFWVDFYIDPSPAPTGPNQLWFNLSNEGLAWGITNSLAPQESLTLSFSTDPGAANEFYVPEESLYNGSLPAGTPVYVQVDSAHVNVPYGGILETHEITGGTYNNIASATATGVSR